MRLPRVAERMAPEEGEIEQRGDDDEPEAVAPVNGAGLAVGELVPDAEAVAGVVEADDGREERRGDEHARGEDRAPEPGEAPVDGEGDEQRHRAEAAEQERERPRELAGRGAVG